MTAFCNTSKDKGKPVLSFSLTLVIKRPIHSLSFNCGNHKVPEDTQKDLLWGKLIHNYQYGDIQTCERTGLEGSSIIHEKMAMQHDENSSVASNLCASHWFSSTATSTLRIQTI